MNIIRWLLCHLLSITLLISIVLIFSFWDELKSDFSSLTGGVTQAEVNELKDPDAVTVVEKKYQWSAPAKTVTTTAVESQVTQPQQKTDDPWSDVLESDVKQVGDADNPAADLELETSFPPENYDPESSAAEVSNMQSMIRNEPAKALPHTAGMETENTVTDIADYFPALEEARRLYWEGKPGLAQAAYESLMFKYQNMPEAAAELGNLLWQQGDQNGAIWAYKNAIPRYLNLHREQEAISIMRLLSQYDPAIAEKLQKKYW